MPAPTLATAPEAPAAAVPASAPLAPVAAAPAPSATWKRAWTANLPWGSGATQAGRSVPAEGSPEAPSSLAVSADGRIWLLDQVNSRVLVLKINPQQQLEQALPAIPVSRTAQDLTVSQDGTRLYVVDRLVKRQLVVWDVVNQKEIAHVAIDDSQLPNPAGETAIFLWQNQVFLEYEHAEALAVAGLNGEKILQAGTPPHRLGGRIATEKGAVMRALKTQPQEVLLTTWFDQDRENLPTQRTTVHFDKPVLQIAGLDTLGSSLNWLTVDVVSQPTETPRRIAVGLNAELNETQRLELCAPVGPEEQLRTTVAGPDHAFYNVCRGDLGLKIERWAP